MNRKTVFLLVGMLVVALAAVGIGYGLWFEDLKVHGEVTTGELDIDFSFYEDSIYQYFSDENGKFLCDYDTCPEKFDTVKCSAEIFENEQIAMPATSDSDLWDPDWINVFVEGAYPSFTCEIEFDINNAGSVPVHLAYYWEGDWDPGLVCAYDQTYEFPFFFIDGIFFEDELGLYPVQLHNGGKIWCKGIVHFTNYDSEEFGIGELDTFYFQYHFRGFQWNESPMFDKYPIWPPLP